MKKMKIVFVAGVVIALTAMVFGFVSMKPETGTTLAAEVDKDYQGMESIVEEAVANESELALSSNPYDYTNNEYYKNLVSKGADILPILENKLESDEYDNGLLAYLTALAIEDVTECDLKEDLGRDWATADEFQKQWDDVKEEVVELVESDKDITKEESEKRLNKYGKLAAAAIKKCGLKSGEALSIEKNIIEEYQATEEEIDSISDCM